MKKIVVFSVLCLSFFLFSYRNNTNHMATKAIVVQAPFEMPAITIPDFSNCDTLSITSFGASMKNKDKTTRAIELAITTINKKGGGTVLVPKGEWITGKIHFKSNVNLHLAKGATLVFSDEPKEYLPPVHSTWEGYECYNYSPLIYAYQCKNIALTGQGEIKAKMDIWKTWFKRVKGHMESLKRLYYLASYSRPMEERKMVNDSSNFRPQFIQFNRCENVLVEDVTITNSPFWTLHPFMSKNIVLRNLKVYAHGLNNDGVDPEMSQNILIENCVFDQGDDAIAIKSGSNQDAWRLHTPSKNIVIRNCTVKNGHQLVALGSELSGGIENVFVDNCRVVAGAKLNHLLFIKTNERRGGYVQNIYLRNTSSGKIDQGIIGIETDVLYQWRDLVPTIERKLTPIKNIYLENISATNVKFISRVLGQKDLPIENLVLTNVHADTIQVANHIHQNLLSFTCGK